MLDFMSHVQLGFQQQTRWNIDNSYASLTTTATNLLDFSLPRGIRLHVSSLSSPNFATSYTLASKGVVDGSLSFLYSSLGLRVQSKSGDVSLVRLVQGYRHLLQLQAPYNIDAQPNELQQNGGSNTLHQSSAIEAPQRKDTLLYGRLYLPTSTLEALYLRRLTPTRLLRLSCVSDAVLPNGGTLLAHLQNDYGKYSTEYLYSTDSALLGFRALYNFGYDPRIPPPSHQEPSPHNALTPNHPWTPQNGRLSLGTEVYFSPLNKTGGLSTGFRFTTLPPHPGFPYTMTLTLNPLMGNLSSTYAVKAGKNLALCSRFDFNVYSYESDVTIGLELWRRGKGSGEVEWARRMIRPEWRVRKAVGTDGWDGGEVVEGVLKGRVSDKGRVGVLWEGRVKALLVSLGAGLDLRGRERGRVVGGVGVEVAFSS